MSNLNNLQWVVVEMTSRLHHVTQSKHENRQVIETKDRYFCNKAFIDRLFLVSEVLRGATLCPLPPPVAMATQTKKAHDD